jgi:translation initiation factor 1 (eIF-1/SUI1)
VCVCLLSFSDLRLKDVSKALGKAFACGASVSDTASGGKEIVIQGDVLDTLPSLLADTYKVNVTHEAACSSTSTCGTHMLDAPNTIRD